MRTTSSGLLLLLVGVTLLSAFVNGALPRLLDTLFKPGDPTTGGAGAGKAGVPPSPGGTSLTTIGQAQTYSVA